MRLRVPRIWRYLHGVNLALCARPGSTVYLCITSLEQPMSSHPDAAPRGGAAVSILPWVTIVVLCGLVFVSRTRASEASRLVVSTRDLVSQSLRVDAIAADSALHVGDTLPSLILADRAGEILSMSVLPGRGYRYLYLYRDECPNCQALRPAWDSMPANVRDSVAFIAYKGGVNLAADSARPHSYALQGLDDGRKHPVVRYIPSLLLVRADGYVESIADGVPNVMRVLRMYPIAPTDRVVLPTTTAPSTRAKQ